MSGETKSSNQSVKEKMDYVDKVLDEYESSNKIKVNVPNEAEKYLNIELDELRKLSIVELAEASYILSRFSLYIQKLYNKEMTRVAWAEHNITRCITKILSQYNAPSREERRHLAILDNEAAKKLDDIRNYAQLRSNRLAFISSKIVEVSKSLNELRTTRDKDG